MEIRAALAAALILAYAICVVLLFFWMHRAERQLARALKEGELWDGSLFRETRVGWIGSAFTSRRALERNASLSSQPDVVRARRAYRLARDVFQSAAILLLVVPVLVLFALGT